MIITVIGTPAPQGSKKGFYNKNLKRVLMVESSAKVKPWRQDVKQAAIDAMAACGACVPAVPGSVFLRVTFTMPKPKSARRGALPDKKPDLSKLMRSTEDALTEAGIWEDDSRVVDAYVKKRYVGERGGMDRPGAVIEVLRAVA